MDSYQQAQDLHLSRVGRAHLILVLLYWVRTQQEKPLDLPLLRRMCTSAGLDQVSKPLWQLLLLHNMDITYIAYISLGISSPAMVNFNPASCRGRDRCQRSSHVVQDNLGADHIADCLPKALDQPLNCIAILRRCLKDSHEVFAC